MKRPQALPATSPTLLEIALEAARRTSPRCHEGQREALGSAWLSSLRFGDHDLSDDVAREDALRSVEAELADRTPELDDPRIDPASIPSWRSSTPFGDAVDGQHARILRNAIDLMPARLATLLRLRHGLGSVPPMSFAEISTTLDIPEEDVETGVLSAIRMIRAALLESQMRSTQGGDEAISQIPSPSPFRVAIRSTSALAAERMFAAGVVNGTHALVDSPAKAAARARAAEASERIDPAWLAREERRRLREKTERLALAARRRAALAAASAVATRAAVDTPGLSVGLKTDADEMRFCVYAFDGRGTDGGIAMLSGSFLTPFEMDARCEELKTDLLRYRDRKVGTKRRRVA